MNNRFAKSLHAVAAATLLGGSLLLAPAASPVFAAQDVPCQVTGGTLTWGVKESFRAYISSTIANGEWKADKGASYETPNFTFTKPTGKIDPATGQGKVSFEGTVNFTGHKGALDLALSNPTIEFEGDGKASLLVDTRSTDMEGKLAIDEKQVWAGDVTAPATFDVKSDALSIDAMPTKLSEAGAPAFAGFYQGGTELDPITIALEFNDCAATEGGQPGAETPTPSTPEAVAPAVTTAEAPVPWVPLIIGGVAVVVISVTATLLISGRKRPAAASSDDTAVTDPAE